MGTTLTGTKPKDTYDSLIKVEDNGPISGTAKYLSDGLGNNLPIAVSTSNVGIGTSAPAANLHIASAADTGIRIQGGASNLSYIDLADTASGTPAGSIAYNHISNAIVFATDTNVERARITSNGLSFNGDTAAANALDDYEEGTFTPVPVGWTTNPTSLSGKYTKIGALVSIKFTFTGGVKANATSAYFTGLPFAGAEAGGGTVSSTGVDDLGIILLDNSDRIWLTQNTFAGFVAKGTGSYMLV